MHKVLDVALAEVGYKEKATNAYLDDKNANAGRNNWTKYGRDMISNVGAPFSNGTPWCDTFVDWCFYKAYGKEEARRLLCGWSAYTPTSADYFRRFGQFSNEPKVGDVIFFKDTNGTICHTGLVYMYDGNMVYTIEGNTEAETGVIDNGGIVAKKAYNKTYAMIAGYGRPKYNEELTSINDIVWELHHRGVITDKELWLDKLEKDVNAYWLARKSVKYIKENTK